ncbi:hypothetical protein CBR_g51446 [Chara braunii]|uniref:Uncharacterized protein n=1 Tax=Chara braunii TaxID=69332 RepID=A0A388K686_CHABU|nr:hypothetical protein CBR_g51446 [Chara braunii]|eukprot:GBG65562.1 hypothetical protein CBR_g51446 [Chara braunii]
MDTISASLPPRGDQPIRSDRRNRDDEGEARRREEGQGKENADDASAGTRPQVAVSSAPASIGMMAAKPSDPPINPPKPAVVGDDPARSSTPRVRPSGVYVYSAKELRGNGPRATSEESQSNQRVPKSFDHSRPDADALYETPPLGQIVGANDGRGAEGVPYGGGGRGGDGSVSQAKTVANNANYPDSGRGGHHPPDGWIGNPPNQFPDGTRASHPNNGPDGPSGSGGPTHGASAPPSQYPPPQFPSLWPGPDPGFGSGERPGGSGWGPPRPGNGPDGPSGSGGPTHGASAPPSQYPPQFPSLWPGSGSGSGLGSGERPGASGGWFAASVPPHMVQTPMFRNWVGETNECCLDFHSAEDGQLVEGGHIYIRSFFCPCSIFGKTMEMAGLGKFKEKAGLYLVSWLVFTILAMVSIIVSVKKKNTVGWILLGILIWALRMADGLLGGLSRTKLREKFQPKGNACSDVGAHSWYPAAALTQEYRTMAVNVRDGVWVGPQPRSGSGVAGGGGAGGGGGRGDGAGEKPATGDGVVTATAPTNGASAAAACFPTGGAQGPVGMPLSSPAPQYMDPRPVVPQTGGQVMQMPGMMVRAQTGGQVMQRPGMMVHTGAQFPPMFTPPAQVVAAQSSVPLPMFTPPAQVVAAQPSVPFGAPQGTSQFMQTQGVRGHSPMAWGVTPSPPAVQQVGTASPHAVQQVAVPSPHEVRQVGAQPGALQFIQTNPVMGQSQMPGVGPPNAQQVALWPSVTAQPNQFVQTNGVMGQSPMPSAGAPSARPRRIWNAPG